MRKTIPEKTRKSRKARTIKFQKAYNGFLEDLIVAREEVGLSQHGVSAAMERSPNFMTKCESGERSIDVMELLELATLYKKSIIFTSDGRVIVS